MHENVIPKSVFVKTEFTAILPILLNFWTFYKYPKHTLHGKFDALFLTLIVFIQTQKKKKHIVKHVIYLTCIVRSEAKILIASAQYVSHHVTCKQ